MDPEIIMLGKESQKVKDKYHDMSCMCNLTYDSNELIYKTEAGSQIDIESELMATQWERG